MNPELLAPAGSMASLISAVHSGADAVYLGLNDYNARTRAKNFSMEDLLEAVEYCHLRGVSVYLALNILLKDDEIDDALNAVVEAYQAGIDAVIIQDMGLCALIYKYCPGLNIHASTQMNVYIKDAFFWVKKWGVSRVILPREWSLKDISQAVRDCREIGVETEVFVHGAHCVSCSGVCLLSAMCGVGVRSGNRGNCAQPCREKFTLFSGQERLMQGPILSVKDRSALRLMDELIQTGVDCIKIEGRLRDNTYVAVTVAVYRKYLDAYWKNQKDKINVEQWEHEMMIAYNRGGDFSDQYFKEAINASFNAGQYVGKYGVYLGRVIDKNEYHGWISIRTRIHLYQGDILSFRNKDGEMMSFPIGRVQEIKNASTKVWGAHPKQFFQLDASVKVYLTFRRAHNYRVLERLNYGLLPIKVKVTNHNEDHLSIYVSGTNHKGKDITVQRIFSLPSGFNGSPVRADIIKKQFFKTGDYPFRVEMVDINATSTAMPISFINMMRRQTYADYKTALLSIDRPKLNRVATPQKIDNKAFMISKRPKEQCVVEYIDLNSFVGNLDCGADIYVFSASDILDENQNKRIKTFLSDNINYAIRMPPSGRYNNMIEIKKQTDIFVTLSRGCFKGYFSSVPVRSDTKTHISSQGNVMNSSTLLAIASQGVDSISLSYELNEKDFAHLVNTNEMIFQSCALILHRYGKTEWMHSSYCVFHELGCVKKRMSKTKEPLYLGVAFNRSIMRIICDCKFCTMTLWGEPQWIPDNEIIDVFRNNGLRLLHMIRIIDENVQDVEKQVKAIRESFSPNLY